MIGDAAAAAARRADERARPGRPADGARAARELRARGVAVLLNSHLLSRGRAGVRPRGDDRARRGGRGRHAGRALARRRRRGRRPAAARGSSRRPRARTSRGSCASWSRRARTSTRSASCARRSRTPTSRWSAADEGRRDRRGVRAARVAAPARVRRRRAAHRRVPRALRRSASGRSPRRPTRSAASTGRRRARSSPGATLLGLSMFATLFLGAILAVFLTLNAVRGDAERGLLQPMIVRPLPRGDVPARPLRGRGGRVRGLRDRRLPRLGGASPTASSTGGRTG